MKNSIACLILSGLLSFNLFAQDVPGYQGKTMSFGYSPSFSMAVTNVNSNQKMNGLLGLIMGEGENDSIPKAFLAINATHAFTFNYVYKRNASFVGRIQFMKTGCWISPIQDSYETQTPFGYSSVNYSTPNYFAKMSGFGFDAGIKWYKNNLAPIGRYSGYRLGLNFYSGKAPKVDSLKAGTYNPWSYYYETTAALSDQKFHSTNLRLIYMWGKQSIIKDKILLDICLDWDLISSTRAFYSLAAGGDGIGNLQYDETVLGDYYEKYAMREMRRRGFARDAFELRIALGYLL